MLLLSLLGKSVAAKAAVGVATVSLSGVTVAASTGSLPAPVQQVAYDVAGDVGVPAPSAPADTDPTEPVPGESPAADPSASPSPSSSDPSAEPSEDPDDDASGTGPDATGPAAKGLCEAYRHGGAKPGSVKERALAGAAGSVDMIGAYCDTVLAARDERRPAKSPAPTTTASEAQPAGTKKPETVKTKEPRPAKSKAPQVTKSKSKAPQATKS